MANYKKIIAEDRRLSILLVLKDSESYKCNQYVLQDIVAGLGHDVSLDLLSTEINWLEEQGLVTVKKINSVVIVILTNRGLDVAEGRTKTPGVKKPRPE